MKAFEFFQKQFPDVKENQLLAPYTRLGIGGSARLFLVVKDSDVLRRAMAIAKEKHMPVAVMEEGSEALVSSKGFPGLVILDKTTSHKKKTLTSDELGVFFFKDPSLEYTAAFLLDKIGARGERLGDAVISDQCGNLFLNNGNATSEDVLKLAERVRRRVLLEYGIMLERKVKYVGKPSFSLHATTHPVLKWVSVIVLLFLALVGAILPVLPGFVFFLLALYVIWPDAVVKWFGKIRAHKLPKDKK